MGKTQESILVRLAHWLTEHWQSLAIAFAPLGAIWFFLEPSIVFLKLEEDTYFKKFISIVY